MKKDFGLVWDDGTEGDLEGSDADNKTEEQILAQKKKIRDKWAIIVEDLPEENRENNEAFNRNNERFILRITNEWWLRWDLLVMIFATWNCIVIPIEIGMKPHFA